MKCCEDCIHIEVCAMCLPPLPICDSYKGKEDVVSKGLFDQLKWERDIAIEQLEKLGVGFGQKIDGVYLSKCDYEELLRYKYMYEDLCR